SVFSLPPTAPLFTLSLHDALPIFFAQMALLEMAAEFRAKAQQLELRERRRRQRFSPIAIEKFAPRHSGAQAVQRLHVGLNRLLRSEEHTSELQSRVELVCRLLLEK